ncbi:MAG TPA: SDR family oxidoreductase [Candidatus Acidoferrales bacterium]|nr:SDR family oxidoreductase [Candidatus Acidoferrales bacterium]
MASISSNSETSGAPATLHSSGEPVFWRVEGSLLNLTAVRPVAFFAWNAQSFLGRWTRRGAMAVLAVARPLLYVTHRVMATRLLHTVLRGVSRDRLDLLGEEYFQYEWKPRLKRQGLESLAEAMAAGADVVLVSQGLDHVMRPLAKHLGVRRIICNRLDFQGTRATGRLLEPVIRPRGIFARLRAHQPDGRLPRERLLRDLGLARTPDLLDQAIQPTERPGPLTHLPVVRFGVPESQRLRPQHALRGKHIVLLGSTGFIGKVWFENLLSNVPEVGRISLLIRRTRSATPLERFQRMVEESPIFERLAQRHGERLAAFLRDRVEAIEADVTQPDLGLAAEIRERLAQSADLIVNSSGLTDFNPDLRDALATNIRATTHLLDFLRECRHASLMHLSTCYVVGRRDGRVQEELPRNYTPRGIPDFEAREEWESLEQTVRDAEARANSPEMADEWRRQAVSKQHAARDLQGAALENQIRKNRLRWLRQYLTDAGTARANELGWPNTYTFTKSLTESLIREHLDQHPEAAIAVVRPAIVESSVQEPFLGWNEGINTSASLSYLLGTFFRQLPTRETKCLDLVPVDVVARGMTLVGAALVTRRHARVYHLATSVTNPCDMRRSIELTGLGHRRFYRAQNGLHHRLRLKFDAIPVSKARYEKLSAPAQKAIVQAINRSVEPLRFVRPPLARQERDLEKVIKLVSLFEPFILHNDHVFEAVNIERLSAALPAEDREQFSYEARSVDWWDYWINVHIPALRKWCYPLIEGRQPEIPPRRNVPLAADYQRGAADAAGAAPRTP